MDAINFSITRINNNKLSLPNDGAFPLKCLINQSFLMYIQNGKMQNMCLSRNNTCYLYPINTDTSWDEVK